MNDDEPTPYAHLNMTTGERIPLYRTVCPDCLATVGRVAIEGKSILYDSMYFDQVSESMQFLNHKCWHVHIFDYQGEDSVPLAPPSESEGEDDASIA